MCFIQDQETLIEELRNQLNQSQTNLKSHQEQLNRAVSELDNHKRALEQQHQAYQLEVERVQARSLAEVESLMKDLAQARGELMQAQTQLSPGRTQQVQVGVGKHFSHVNPPKCQILTFRYSPESM